MKFSVFFLALFGAGALARSTSKERSEAYDKYCPEKHRKEVEISPGLTVRILCDSVGRYSGEKISGFDTPRECAEECSDRPECVGSNWDQAQGFCLVSDGKPPPGGGSRRRGSIQMIIVEDNSDDPDGPDGPNDPDGPDGPDDPDSSCDDICDECASKVKKCNCNDDRVNCGYTDGAQFKKGGRKYTAHCNKLDDPGYASLKSFTADSVEDCVAACSNYPNNKCKRAIWSNNAASGGKTPCYLRDWTNSPCEPTKDSAAFSSAHVHDKKCSN